MSDPLVSGDSLVLLRNTVREFGAAAGMPFLELDDGGAAAVQLDSGFRLELEYVPASDRLLVHLELGAPVPTDAVAWTELFRSNIRLMSSHGLSAGLGRIEGEDRLVLLASLPAATLTTDQLGEAAMSLVSVSERLGSEFGSSANAGLLRAISDSQANTPVPGSLRI